MSVALAADHVGVFFCTVHDEAGELVEATQEPVAFLAGHKQVVPGLEAALLGKEAGSSFDITLAPADAYGEHNGRPPLRVHRRDLPKDQVLEKGRAIWVPTPKGEARAYVVDVKGAWVTLDGNHPLSGRTLRFQGVLIRVREATSEEKTHGHAHGMDGVPHDH